MPFVAAAQVDVFITKTVNSAFMGDPDLHSRRSAARMPA